MFKKPTVFSDESGSHVLGKDGGIKASFSIADHGESHEGAAVSHLQQNFDDYMAEEVEELDEISSDMAHRYLKGKHERDYDISPDGKSSKLKKPQSFAQMNKDMKSTARALRTIEKAKKTNEEVEQIDELKDKTLGSYINKAKDSIDTASYRQGHKEAHGSSSKALERKLSKRHKGIETAVKKLTREEVELDEAHKIAKKVMKENKFLTGVLNKLEEGRGRPASPPKPGKAPSAAWLRHLENIKNPAAEKPKERPDALGMQLRKAKSVNAHVEFDDGKKHEIHLKHINAFDDHMAARRTPQEKHAFQKKASASHDAFVKAVSEPMPAEQDHGDRGFPKYRH